MEIRHEITIMIFFFRANFNYIWFGFDQKPGFLPFLHYTCEAEAELLELSASTTSVLMGSISDPQQPHRPFLYVSSKRQKSRTPRPPWWRVNHPMARTTRIVATREHGECLFRHQKARIKTLHIDARARHEPFPTTHSALLRLSNL